MKLKKNKVEELLNLLAKDAKVLVPVEVDTIKKFDVWGETNGKLALDEVNMLLPPKDALFPQTEHMYKYKVDNEKVAELEEIKEDPEQVIFGIRPCDMRAIECMDDVFLTKTYVDDFYKDKKDKLTTIAIGCNKVEPTCFCDSMGLSPNQAPAADIMMHEVGEEYAVIPQSDKGKAFVEKISNLLEEGELDAPKTECELKVDAEGVPEKLSGMFNHSIWDEFYRGCIGCGICTYLCPTCYCFDIDGENVGNEGVKFRCWDSCMFSEYTRMAGGHNPRPSKKERLRNRFLHKTAYFKERYDKMLCVGCGRCVAECPSSIDITRFIDRAKEVEANG